MFESYNVGKCYPNARGHSECILFDITGAGILMPVYMSNPRPDDLAKQAKMIYRIQ